ncbi:MAG: sigma-54 dependent transcriptional regulator [Proteobacteria bacterium]|nr:sigma-54 dependent transcriptional regulator [Pseudomonadota bacterium]
MNPLSVLIVDDALPMREALAAWLGKAGYVTRTAGSGREALDSMQNEPSDLVMLDVKMPGMDGLEVLERLKAEHPRTLVVMITAYGSIESAVEAMKQGASDYLLKPFDPEQLVLLITKLAGQMALIEENERLQARLAERDRVWLEDLIGESAGMRAVFGAIEEVAGTDAPVLITGETGTGKELAARAVHARGQRPFGPFVAINCGAVTENLLESELFGHERGAFTGAVQARRGRIELADAGTLFLDEIGEISPRMQVNLLRVLDDKSYYRLGGVSELQSDFRLICATHRDLGGLIEAGRFRRDFYYRINVIGIHVPPLRERAEDVPLLAVYFLNRFAREMGKPIEGLSREAMELLAGYGWPGNVRELRNVMERAVVVGQGPLIGAAELTFLRPPAAGNREGTLADVEAEHIRQTLALCAWNMSRAARRLEVDRGTLARKMKKYNLSKPG